MAKPVAVETGSELRDIEEVDLFNDQSGSMWAEQRG